MTIEVELKKLQEDGLLFKRNLIAASDCKQIISYVDQKEARLKIPFSNVAWGYGNLIKDEHLKSVYNNAYIRQLCNLHLGKDFVFNHLMINNKAPWIGPGVEWHQECLNIDTFAPGVKEDPEGWKNFLQIYIALDRHTIENGCLRVIPGSYKLGELPSEDIINENFGHKRRIPYEIMQQVAEKYKIENILMERGDALFFNHRTLHASSSNVSPYPRKSIVLQARLPFQKNDETYKKETQYRQNFILNALENKIASLKEKNLYDDFKKGKSNENK